jgi:hypothetical protein
MVLSISYETPWGAKARHLEFKNLAKIGRIKIWSRNEKDVVDIFGDGFFGDLGNLFCKNV